MAKKYTDPLSVLQAQTVGMTSVRHLGKLSDDELVIALGEELEEAQQAIREAIERAKPKQVVPPSTGLDPEGYDMGRKRAIDEYHANLLKELGLDE